MQLIRSAGITAADSQLKAYVNWVHHVQQDSDPNGIDVRGEPKVSHSSCISLHVCMQPSLLTPPLSFSLMVACLTVVGCDRRTTPALSAPSPSSTTQTSSYKLGNSPMSRRICAFFEFLWGSRSENM